MKTLRIILIVLAALAGIFLIMGLVLPKDYQLERSIVIEAAPEVVFPYVQRFEERSKWYSWNKLDPDMDTALEGPDGQVGTVYKWTGDPQTVGSGSQEIVEIVPNEKVRNKIVFEEPMEAEAMDYVTLEPVEAGTRVNWGFESRFPFPWNALLPFMGMEKSVGKDYEEGLSALKELVESQPKAAARFRGFGMQVVDMPERHFVLLRDRVSFDEMPQFFERTYGELTSALKQAGAQMAGHPSALYYSWDEEEQMTDMAPAFPIRRKGTFPSAFSQTTLPAGKAIVVDYRGGYDRLSEAHNAVDAFARENGMTLGAPAMEEYITGPEQEPDTSRWLTQIIYPVES